MQIERQEIRVLSAVIEEGGFSRAAERLCGRNPLRMPFREAYAIADGFCAATAGRPQHGTYHPSDDRPLAARAMAAIGG